MKLYFTAVINATRVKYSSNSKQVALWGKILREKFNQKSIRKVKIKR